MEIPVEADSRVLPLASRASQRPLNAGQARKYLKAAPGRGLMLAALLIAVPSISHAQQASPSASQVADDEPLAEQVTDPLSYLTQIQIKDPYTPAEYGTNAQPNTVQLRAIFAIRPFSFIPVEQLVRPTIKIVTVSQWKGCVDHHGIRRHATARPVRDTLAELQGDRFPLGNRVLTSCFQRRRATALVINRGRRGRPGPFPTAGFRVLILPGFCSKRPHSPTPRRSLTPVSSLTFQPILSYQLGHRWYLKSSDATWTFNLRHNTSTKIPLSAGFGRVWELSKGYAIDTSASGEWTAYRQFTNQTEQFTINFQVGLLFPKLEF